MRKWIALAMLLGCHGELESADLDGGSGIETGSGGGDDGSAGDGDPGSGSGAGGSEGDGSSGDDGGDDGTDESTGDTDGGSDGGIGGGPPEVSLTSNNDQITEGGSVTFTAYVDDPDDDVDRGWLRSPDESFTYAEFVFVGDRYEARITWNDIDGESSIEFDGDAKRSFVAIFEDDALNVGRSNTVVVTLHCGGWAACGGVCTSGTDNENCGGCGNTCEVGDWGDGACEAGECGLKFDGPWFMVSPAYSCFDRCTYLGQTCVANACGGSTYLWREGFSGPEEAHSAACGDVIPESMWDNAQATCCCE